MAENKELEAVAELLACPCSAHGRLVATASGYKAECCGRDYKVVDGIAVLLMTEA